MDITSRFLMFFCLLSFATIAQDVSWGEPVDTKANRVFPFHFDEKGYCIWYQELDNACVVQYSLDHKVIKGIQAPEGIKSDGHNRLEFIETTKGKFALSYGVNNRAFGLNVAKFQDNQFLPTKTLVSLSKSKGYEYSSYMPYNLAPNRTEVAQVYPKSDNGHHIKISKNKEFVLFYSVRGRDNKSPKNEHYILYMFDADMNLVWDKKITLDVKDEAIKIEDIQIANDGQRVFLLRKWLGEFTKNRIDGLDIHIITKDTERLEYLEMARKVESIPFRSHLVYDDEHDSFLVTGLSTSMRANNKLSGVYAIYRGRGHSFCHRGISRDLHDSTNYQNSIKSKMTPHHISYFKTTENRVLPSGNIEFLIHYQKVEKNNVSGGTKTVFKDMINIVVTPTGSIIKREVVKRDLTRLDTQMPYGFVMSSNEAGECFLSVKHFENNSLIAKGASTLLTYKLNVDGTLPDESYRLNFNKEGFDLSQLSTCLKEIRHTKSI